MNNPFEYEPDQACAEAFGQLLARIDATKLSQRDADIRFCRELDAGKMLGVMIATDNNGDRQTLYAFSGQIGDAGFYHDGFVGPVFDYLEPGGYFKTREAGISSLSRQIAEYVAGPLAEIESEYASAKQASETEVGKFKIECRQSKQSRDALRAAGNITDEESAAMTRRSQFEKAELSRLKKRVKAALAPLEARLREARSHVEALKEKRRDDSEALQQWLFSNFKVLNARGESRSLSEIFADTAVKVPPSGAGECCAPKLLQAAYRLGWRPISMAEYWYGKPKDGEVRIHGEHYPACRGKCLPVLNWMLQGLPVEPPLNREPSSRNAGEPKIVFENEWFCIVDKPSGMLSVPGKGTTASLADRLEDHYGQGRDVKPAHRLDQDTSGLIIATFGRESFKVIQSLFATRKIKKTYMALLDGDYESRGIPRQGHIDLPLSPDWTDRPRQRVDYDGGKEAVTDYEFIDSTDSGSRVLFHPRTGRTHQLRVHSASPDGLGLPIVGDRLYGHNGGNGRGRLHLHATKIEFTFPIDGRHYSFDSPTPF